MEKNINMEIKLDKNPFTSILHYYGVVFLEQEYPFIIVHHKDTGLITVEWTRMFPMSSLKDMKQLELDIISRFNIEINGTK